MSHDLYVLLPTMSHVLYVLLPTMSQALYVLLPTMSHVSTQTVRATIFHSMNISPILILYNLLSICLTVPVDIM